MGIAVFSEERFPARLALGTSGGPERRTEIVRLSTGFETRNQRQAHAMRRYDAGGGVRSLDDLAAVLAFFEARRGRLVGFRFRDPFDHSSALYGRPVTMLDQVLGIGDGARREFALAKTYGAGADSYRRPIEKPVAATVRVSSAGVARAIGPALSLDAAKGLLTFAAAPPVGASVTAGFEFDVPVRFDMDQLSISLAAFEAGEIPTIPLVEIRP